MKENDTIPSLLTEALSQRWSEELRQAKLVPMTDPVRLSMEPVWACSDFIAHGCSRYPEMFEGLLGSGDLEVSYLRASYSEKLQKLLVGIQTEQELQLKLRQFRLREMVRIAWRDLAGWADLEKTIEELSWLADACIMESLVLLYDWKSVEMGTPCGSDGKPQKMVVLGMGKLGAFELNFSSDIDLICAFPHEGVLEGGKYSNEEFFARLTRQLMKVLGEKTADGFVYRVDLRLRPFGDSGPLAISFDALEDYYQIHGREWERYAMVKARAICGDEEDIKQLRSTLMPFVYRRYLDYGSFESLREMKSMIQKEIRRKGVENNIKLGRGGIREIEFIGQSFQLIRGGREPALQERSIMKILSKIAELDYLPSYVIDELQHSYEFLRRVENRLQEFADQQTHVLPSDPLGQQRLAFSMGFADWYDFDLALQEILRSVDDHFQQVFAAPQNDHAENDELDLSGIWLGELDGTTALATLQGLGYVDVQQAYQLLISLRESRTYLGLEKQGKQRLDRLMPLLIGAISQIAEQPTKTLHRIVNLLEAMARRSAYVALLVENPMAMSQLVRLFAYSPWIASFVAKYPIVLDELLDPRTLYAPPGRDDLGEELRQQLLRIPEDDLEQLMEVLRHYKHNNVFRVAAADVADALPLMEVSDHLTWIAEQVLQATLSIVWHDLTQKHGLPQQAGMGFVVVAYGKLGGIELGYGSDLDVIFLHSDEGFAETDGQKVLERPVFYARLVQRLFHIFSTRTASGQLYEIDTRLRPSGSSGLLVSSLSAYEDYQREDAWTWEHQALVRARVVAGDQILAKEFARVRHEILTQSRDQQALRQSVKEMREKMRTQLGSKNSDQFDLKQDRGGIADIEFMVQYGVLAWASEYPQLCEFTDNIRLLESFSKAGLMTSTDTEALCEAYSTYRKEVHRLTLQEQPATVAEGVFKQERQVVEKIWQKIMES